MKKLHMFIALLMLITLMVPAIQVSGAQPATIDILIDGQKLALKVKPTIINGRTLVPLRGVFEKLDATVDWNKETRQAIIKNDAIEVLMSPDFESVLLNGQIHPLDTSPTIIDDTLMIPIRFVAESLGHTVDWDAINRDVLITTSQVSPLVTKTELPLVGSRSSLEALLAYNNDLHTYINRSFALFDDFMVAPELEDALTRDDLTGNSSAETTTGLDEKSYTDTNNQVAGVDEGDIVKTNGSLIAHIKDGQVNLIDTNPTEPKVLTTINIDPDRGQVSNLYLTDKQLMIIGSSYVYYSLPRPTTSDNPLMVPSTYPTSNTFTLVYDLTTPTKPTLVMDMDYEGTYLSSRLVSDTLYMVTQKNLNYWSLSTLTDQEIQPKYGDNLANTITLIDYDALHYFPDYVAPSIMMTIGINLEEGTSQVEAYLGQAETVYANQDTMYLAFTHYSYGEQLNALIYVPNYNKSTAIYQFSLDEGQMTYKNKGTVPGTVINQFSMDAYKDHLRVATTSGEMWNDDQPSENNLYILNSDLETVGAVTGLAPGERIYSTRFHQDRIYMVTYRQVDPFFVLDAADPTAPKVLGALKVPGFSTYMHVLDANHILGFGTDTSSEDGLVRTGGLKLSLFDVTDPSQPIESKKEVIGLAGSYSEIQNNHKALMISLEKGLMAFPLTIAGQTPYVTDFSGAYLYDLTNASFTYRGQVSHGSDKSQSFNYTDTIQRLLVIDDTLYSLSDSQMKVYELDGLTLVGQVDFEAKNHYDLPILEPAK